MFLGDQSARAGAWLFRWRGYLPLGFLAVMIPALSEFSYPFGSRGYRLVWELFCLSVSLLGLFIRGYTVGHTPEGTSGRNSKGQVAQSLNTTGLYSVTRNPLYLGNFYMTLGPVLFPGVWWAALIYIFAFWLCFERIIMAEEAFLKEKFGQEYEAYCARTPIFMPKFGLWEAPTLPFSMRNVLKREYPGFFFVIISMTAFKFAGDYVVAGSVVLDPVWATIFLMTLLVSLGLRILKKKTRILDIEGR